MALPPVAAPPHGGSPQRAPPPPSSKVIGGWYPTSAAAGSTATVPDFSFMVAVFTNTSHRRGVPDWQSVEPTCSGIVVHPMLVLTAAHCVVDVDNTTLVIGGVERPRSAGVARRRITSWYPHRRYVPGGATGRIVPYDLMVLELEEALPASIATPALLSTGAATMPPAGVFVTAAGYGVRAEDWVPDNPTNANTLSSVDLPLQSAGACAALYAHRGFNASLNGCAGYLDVAGCDTCQFDSGGPVFYRDAATADAIVIGVTVWGEGCGRLGRPGVFTLIADELSGWVAAYVKVRMRDSTGFRTPAALVASAASTAPAGARPPLAGAPPVDRDEDAAGEPLPTAGAADASTDDDGGAPRSAASSSSSEHPPSSRRDALRVAFVVVTSVFAACTIVAVVSVVVVDTRWRRAARTHSSGSSGLAVEAVGGGGSHRHQRQRTYGAPRFASTRGGGGGSGPTPPPPVAGSLEWMGIARLGRGEADLV